MENKKQLFLAAILFLFLGTSQGMAQEKDPQTVIIRAFELSSGKASHLTVTLPDGTINSIDLSVVDLKTFQGESGNSTIIQSQINEWKKQGFELDGLSAISTYLGGMVTTIILSKD